MISSNSALSTSETTTSAVKPNPFDPESLRINTSIQHVIAKPALLHVRVGKPQCEEWVRTRPAEEWLQVAIFEARGNCTYLLTNLIAKEMAVDNAIRIVDLVVTVNQFGSPSLWPLKCLRNVGLQNKWSVTAREAANMATLKWTRIQSDQDAGEYKVKPDENNLDEPKWPDKPISSLLEIAFRGRLIDSLDHPVIRQLKGRV